MRLPFGSQVDALIRFDNTQRIIPRRRALNQRNHQHLTLSIHTGISIDGVFICIHMYTYMLTHTRPPLGSQVDALIQ